MATDSFVKGVDFVYAHTQDIKESERFYSETLGLPVSARYGKLPGVEFETGTVTIAVIEAEAFGLEFLPNKQGIALRVDDVGETRKLLEGAGVNFIADTIDSGVCHMAFFTDPDGNHLLLHHRYAPRA
ncbi:MAG: VOC family protein [Solirubrobacterales bacterium]